MVELTNVKAIRGGVVQVGGNNDNSLPPDPEVVKVAEEILKGAKSSHIREIAYAYCTVDINEMNFGHRGLIFNFTLLFTMLSALIASYLKNEVVPALTGIYPEVDEDE